MDSSVNVDDNPTWSPANVTQSMKCFFYFLFFHHNITDVVSCFLSGLETVVLFANAKKTLTCTSLVIRSS